MCKCAGEYLGIGLDCIKTEVEHEDSHLHLLCITEKLRQKNYTFQNLLDGLQMAGEW